MNYKQIARIFIVIVVIALVCIAAYEIFFYVSTRGKVAVTIYAVPNNADVTLLQKGTGKTIQGRVGTNYLSPDSYKVTVTANGFSNGTGSFSTSDNPLLIQLFSLSPTTSQAKDWLSKHTDQSTKLNQLSDQNLDASSQKASNDFKIASDLPYQNPYYTVGYTLDSNPKVSVTTGSPQYRYAAIQEIRNLGYNPDDYGIVFYDFTNPLTGKVGN